MDDVGQLSAEFLFATLLLIVIVGSLLNIVSSGIDTANSADISKAKVLADTVSRTINTVYSNGYGQYEILELPNETDFNYTVTVDNNGVSVLYKGKTITSFIIPKDHIQSKTMNPGENYTVINNNGTIMFI